MLLIITRTPYRVSLFGGGSDYPSWYERFGGQVLTFTIAKYCHVLVRRMPPFLGSKYRIFWSKGEAVDRIEDIEHPGVRGCLQYLGIQDGIEVNHAGDLPARSGLGSSSAFTVGMLNALHALDGKFCDRARLAHEAIQVEQKILRETVGIQDQIQCAWGGMNWIRIGLDGKYTVQPIILEDKKWIELEDHMVLVFTNLQRYASDIAQDQIKNVDSKQLELHKIAEMVPEAVFAVTHGTPEDLGELLHDAWLLKRELSNKITNPELDTIYDTARKSGAYGGKLLGAGGGGFFLFIVSPEKRQSMLDKLGLLSIPVRLDGLGSHVVLASR